MTDMKQNKETMSAQELENVSGGKIAHPFYQPIFHPIVLGKRNDEGMRSNGASVSTIVADAKPLVLGYGI